MSSLRGDYPPLPELALLGEDSNGVWYLWRSPCASCRKQIYQLLCLTGTKWRFVQPERYLDEADTKYFIRPRTAQRPPPPQGVASSGLGDYREACLVLADSPKASAALSRRCLQHFLRKVVGAKESDLWVEIQEVIDSGFLPSHIAENLDAVRVVGNFAAHPNKSKSTGEIVDVETGEAEWNLVVLESLFDFFYVTLAKNKRAKDAINKKLADIGKKPLK